MLSAPCVGAVASPAMSMEAIQYSSAYVFQHDKVAMRRKTAQSTLGEDLTALLVSWGSAGMARAVAHSAWL